MNTLDKQKVNEFEQSIGQELHTMKKTRSLKVKERKASLILETIQELKKYMYRQLDEFNRETSYGKLKLKGDVDKMHILIKKYVAVNNYICRNQGISDKMIEIASYCHDIMLKKENETPDVIFELHPLCYDLIDHTVSNMNTFIDWALPNLDN